MLEFRKDPVIGRWVIISSERGLRPNDFSLSSDPQAEKTCPFCPGREHLTTQEIYAIRPDHTPPNTPGWRLRVIPNKFPALQIEGHLRQRADGIYDKMNGVGAHEVIIETPDHGKTLSDLNEQEIREIFLAYRSRILDLHNDKRLRYVMVFKNHGQAAGASLSHPHSQLIATPIVPKRVSEELIGSEAYFRYKDRCVFCDIINQEMDDMVRIIESNDHFIAIAPYAPRCPFETWILPRNHLPFFEETPDSAMSDLAVIMMSLMQRIDIVLKRPPYNILIHNSPFDYKFPEAYHWHIEIMPRSTWVAGFEWGTGFYINPTPPEEAAEFLRNTQLAR
ncbi:galactose-1-phosphate uridylyltransferase [bacterium]|nr:galactose-1-phosphate uridylyltransferase [candidate division CSSED10-310 bacterium]